MKVKKAMIHIKQKGAYCASLGASGHFSSAFDLPQNGSFHSLRQTATSRRSRVPRPGWNPLNLLVCLAIVSTVAISGQAADQKPKLALLLFSRGFEFMVALDQGARSEANKSGAELTVLDGQSSSQVQSGQIDDLITQKISAIMISPANSTEIVPAVRRANDASVPVVAVDGIVGEGAKVVTYVGFDNSNGAKVAAEYLLKQHAKKVLELEGAIGEYHAELRHKGFIAGLAADPSIKVISRPAEWQADNAQSMTADALTADPDIDAIYSHNDEMVRGIVSGLKQIGKFHKVGEPGHIIIVGIDGTPLALQRIRSGEEDATVQQDPFLMGSMAVQSALAALAGKAQPPQQLLPPMLVTKENVDTPANWGNIFKP